MRTQTALVVALDIETDGLRLDCEPLELAVVGLLRRPPATRSWRWSEAPAPFKPALSEVDEARLADQRQAREVHRISALAHICMPSWRDDHDGRQQVYRTLGSVSAILCWSAYDASVLEVQAIGTDHAVPALLDGKLWARALWSPADGRPHPRTPPPMREGSGLAPTAAALGLRSETWRQHVALDDALMTLVVVQRMIRYLRTLHGWPEVGDDPRHWTPRDLDRVLAWQRDELRAREAEGEHPWARLHEAQQLSQARETELGRGRSS